MKINLIEKNIENVSNSDVEIIFVKSIENLADREILEILDFKAKDESCVLLAESKKIYVGYEEDN
jgi:leucyl aminopeptidase